MQLQQIHYVLKVHECGSFSAAARELFITQPTLSQQVMALEKELGVTLFIRHPRGVYLTDAGEEFIFYARRILNEVSSMESSMGSYAAQSKGLVKIGVLWVFAYLGIADVLSGFRAAHPQIETSMKVNGSVMLLNMLQNRDVDAIFFISMEQGIQRSDLYAQKLMENDMVAVLPADNPLAGLEVIHYGDLRHHPKGGGGKRPDRRDHGLCGQRYGRRLYILLQRPGAKERKGGASAPAPHHQAHHLFCDPSGHPGDSGGADAGGLCAGISLSVVRELKREKGGLGQILPQAALLRPPLTAGPPWPGRG